MNTHSLIVRLPNWVGDVMMTLPTLQTFHQQGIELQLFGKPWIKDLLATSNFPLHSLESGFWSNRKKLAAIPNDKVLLLTNSFSSALMARLAHKKIIGYTTDNRRVLLNAGIAKRPHLHEVQYFWEISRFAAKHWFPLITWPEQIPGLNLSPNPLTLEKIKQRLAESNISKPFWVLCPFAHGSGKNGQSKIWPHWASLSKHLSKHPTVVCPGKNDEHLCESLVPGATVLADLNLSEFAALLSQAEQVIANDSGPMHIATSVGVKTLGIFGVTDPKRTSPWGGEFIGDLEAWPTLEEVLARINLINKGFVDKVV
ncbi:MAG: glycosyltransferase family 9 protein [Tatlockia sp.]|nr:glycosyltransferase family 9 protein [Tatlockia sp.]